MKDIVNSEKKKLVCLFILSISVCSIILFFSGSHGINGFPLDDAWIHLVYGRSVEQSGYLAYNQGIPSTGCTSPLWGYFIGFIMLFSSSPQFSIILVKIAGIIIHSISVLIVYKIIKPKEKDLFSFILITFFIALNPVLIISALSGMEIVITYFTCLTAFYFYFNKKYLRSGMFFGFSGLARPEMGIVISIVIVIEIFRYFSEKISLKDLLIFFTPVISCALLFMGWNYLIDSRLFPTTFYAKTNLSNKINILLALKNGSFMLNYHFIISYSLLILGLIIFLFNFKKIKKRIEYSLLFFSGFFYIIFSLIIIPPDPFAFYHIRYILPAVPILLIPLISSIDLGIKFIFMRVKEILSTRVLKYFPIIVCVIVLSILLGNIVNQFIGYGYWLNKFTNDCRNINEVQVNIGKKIPELFGKDVVIGTIDAGAVRFFGRRYTVDLMGLNTKEIKEGFSKPLNALVLMPAWIKLLNPDDLKIIYMEKTDNYRVTSNKKMGFQIIAVPKEKQYVQTIKIKILGRYHEIPIQ